MTRTETTLQSAGLETEEDRLSIPSGSEFQVVLSRLIFWSRVVGVTSIITGILFLLGIVALILPAVVMGIFLTIMGAKLLSAGSHLRQVLINRSSFSLSEALRKLRSYIFLNGLLLILSVAFIAAFVIWMVTFGGRGWEIWDQSVNHFVWTFHLRFA